MKVFNLKKMGITLIVCLTVLSSNSQIAVFEKHFFKYGPDTMPYRLLMPENFDTSKKYPLILFLHGSGERGNDNEKQLIHGSTLFTDTALRRKFPAIILVPQCATDDYWSNCFREIDSVTHAIKYTYQIDGDPTLAMTMAIKLTEKLIAEMPVEKTQVYVMGLSMGGMGTYEIVRRMPNTFAAAVPICGGANPQTAKALRQTAWWIFHGEKDTSVPYSFSLDMVNALSKIWGTDLKFSSYPNATHNSWDAAFAEPNLFPWMFRHTLEK